MKKQVDKSKITIVIMSIVFALSLSVTITLAAFSANKTGDVTLTFADGLTMRISPLGTSGRVQFSSADENTATFNYTTQTNINDVIYLDGINAVINKDAYIAYKVEIKETTSGTTIPAGAWSPNGRYGFFEPTGQKNKWRAAFFSGTATFQPVKQADNVFTCTSSTILTASASAIKLMDYIVVSGANGDTYLDDLSGRSLQFSLTVKACTDAAPTFD